MATSLNKRFLSNTVWIIGGQIVKAAIGFVVSLYTAKYLGPSDYGILGYVTSIITLFTALANLGLGNIIVNEILINKNREGEIIGTAIVLQLLSSAISYLLVFATVVVLNIDDKTMWICTILQSFSLILAVSDQVNYYYQSQLKSKIVTIISLIAYIITQIYKVYLLITDKSVVWFAFANTLDYLVVAVLLFSYYIIKKAPKLSFSKNTAKRLLKLCVPFILSGCISVLYTSLDRIMLKELLHDTDSVGYYNVAYTVSHVWVFVVNAVITSFAPLVFETAKEKGIQSAEYKKIVRQLYFLVFWLSVCASVVIDLVAGWFIRFFYGEQYLESIIPTMLLTWSAGFAYLGTARGIQFVCENKQKYIVLFSVLTVFINFGMNMALIPQLKVTGAALATVISEIFVCVIAPLMLKQTRNISIDILSGMVCHGVDLKLFIVVLKQQLLKMFNIKSKKESEDNDEDLLEYAKAIDTEKLASDIKTETEEQVPESEDEARKEDDDLSSIN